MLSGVAVLVLTALLFVWMQPDSRSVGNSPTPTQPTTITPSTAVISSPAAPRQCVTTATSGFVPTRYAIPALAVDEPVVSLGEDADGHIAAPPKDEPRMASWWNGGPKPGSDRGKVVLSIHTYRSGGAIGNELFAGDKSNLTPGDTIKLSDDLGNVACYEYTESLKLLASDYDPQSTVMVDENGPPMVAIIVCWDHVEGTDDWASRVFFYGKAV